MARGHDPIQRRGAAEGDASLGRFSGLHLRLARAPSVTSSERGVCPRSGLSLCLGSGLGS